MLTKTIVLFLWVGAVLLPAQPFSEWTDSGVIRINTGAGGAELAATDTLTNYPLLVKLDQGLFDFSGIQDDGEDIRFAKDDGTVLDFELETWDTANGTGAFWVLMDTVPGGVTDSIMIYWGNDTATNASNPQAVFATASGFNGAWHFNEDPSAGAGSIIDRTENNNHGSPNAMNAEDQVQGVAGGALDFNGTNNTINMGNDSTLDFTGTFTVSGWINPASYRDGHESGLLHKAGSFRYFIRGEGDESNKRKQGVYYGASMGTFRVSETTVELNQWYHVVFATDGTNYTFYLNGVADGTGTTGESIVGNTENVVISDSFGGGRQAGKYDEFRISGARSAAWIKLDYETQRTGQVTVSPPIYAGCVQDFSLSDTVLNINELETGMLNGTAMCAEATAWESVDGDSATSLNMGGTIFSHTVGRISADTSFNLRFKALYNGVWSELDATVNILDSVPDPVFTLADPADWDGISTLTLSPVVTNLAEVEASLAPDINYLWTFSGAEVGEPEIAADTFSTSWAYETGSLEVSLCADNGDKVSCDTATVTITGSLPAPQISVTSPLEASDVWNGDEDIQVSVEVTNISEYTGGAEDALKYFWTTSGITISKTGTSTDSLKMTRAYGDGTAQLKICVSIGTASTCDSLDIEVQRTVQVAMSNLQNPDNPVHFTGGMLLWNTHAEIQIWGYDGKLLFDERGRPGKSVSLHPGIASGIRYNRYIIKVVDFAVD